MESPSNSFEGAGGIKFRSQYNYIDVVRVEDKFLETSILVFHVGNFYQMSIGRLETEVRCLTNAQTTCAVGPWRSLCRRRILFEKMRCTYLKHDKISVVYDRNITSEQ
ncbi:hypothetical protein ACB092_05G252300 [Castanea dentata]